MKNPFKFSRTCQRCPELALNRCQIVHGYGDTNADFLFIGEASGKNGADLTGVPFTRDRSGQRLQCLLIHLGLSQETDAQYESPHLINCYVTNLVRCNPPDNRNPTRVEIEECQPYLVEEIRRIQPKVVIPIGSFAAKWVFRTYQGVSAKPIQQIHAKIFPGAPFTIVPMKHPARISRRMLAQIEVVLQQILLRRH